MNAIKVLLNSENDAKNSEIDDKNSEIYYELANIDVNKDNLQEFTEEILPKLKETCRENLDLLYVSLLSNKSNLLQHLIEFETKNEPLQLEHANTLFNYSYTHKKHWFLQCIENDTKTTIFNDEIHNIIEQLRLIHNTATGKFTIDSLLTQISDIETQENSLFHAYLHEINTLLDISKYIFDSNGVVVTTNDVFALKCKNLSILDVISQITSINDVGALQNFLLTQKNKEGSVYGHITTVNEEFDMLQVLLVFKNVLEAVKLAKMCKSAEMNSFLGNAKYALLGINNGATMVDVVECIYAFIFAKSSYFFNGDTSDVFYCDDVKIVELLVEFLGDIKQAILGNRVLLKESEEAARFLSLQRKLPDILWRLEIFKKCLIGRLKSGTKSVISFLLAPPEGLAQLCLDTLQFEMAHQVLHICSELKDTDVANAIYTTEYINKIRNNTPLKYTAKNYLSTTIFVDQLTNEKNPIFEHLLMQNKPNIHFFDVLLTHPVLLENTADIVEDLLQEVQYDQTLPKLLNNIIAIQTNTKPNNNITIPNILVNSKICKNFDFNDYTANINSLNNISTLVEEFSSIQQVNKKLEILVNIQELCMKFCIQNQYIDDINTQNKYISRLLNYLKIYTKLYNLDKESEHKILPDDGKILNLLNFNQSEHVKNLIENKNYECIELEPFYRNLKQDLTYHIANCYFPNINFTIKNNSECLNLNKTSKINVDSVLKPSEKIIQYINSRNWVLGYILSYIHDNQANTNISMQDKRVFYMNNYFNLPIFDYLKCLFANNHIIAAFGYFNCKENVHEYILGVINESLQLKNQNFDLEGDSLNFNVNNWFGCFSVLDAVNFVGDGDLLVLYDDILCKLVTEGDNNCCKYVRFIKNNELRTKIILKEMKHWSVSFCVEIVGEELSKVGNECQKNLEGWFPILKLHEKLTIIFPDLTWYEIHENCLEQSETVLKGILQTTKLDTLLEYILVFNPQESELLQIDAIFLDNCLKIKTHELKKFKSLFVKLPRDHLEKQLNILLTFIKDIEQLEFVANELKKLLDDQNYELTNLQISLQILKILDRSDQDLLFDLIFDPILILEVLIMNTKLDKFTEVLNQLKEVLDSKNYEEFISYAVIDDLLRVYAKKSLDFRIISSYNPVGLNDYKLMQSLESSVVFIPPEEVPKRENWILDSEVLQCMCCKCTIFSMFNRRHHCRRCGRVVCFSCSTKKAQVEGYENIAVRVCNDCYDIFFKNESSNCSLSHGSNKSAMADFWILSNNKHENEIIRQEFSYEHAPSISLCLAILKNHSKNVEFSRFLLDQCMTMLKIIKPMNNDISQQIDYKFLVRMIKSLAVASKLHSLKIDDYNSLQQAEKILKQADLYLFFIEKGHINLLSNAVSDFVDGLMLRNLRDKLLKDEQFELALEVNTKFGLDSKGVFAEKGKTYLRAGKFEKAREIFKICFSDNQQQKLLTKNRTRTVSTSSNLSESSKSEEKAKKTLDRILNDPPLLKEIIKILEKYNHISINEQIVEKNKISVIGNEIKFNDKAFYIQNKLYNLNNIAKNEHKLDKNNKLFNLSNIANNEKIERNKKAKKLSNDMQIVINNECLYYLTNYASYLSILQFFVKNNEYSKCFEYIFDKNIGCDIFTELFMISLQEGTSDVLLERMKSFDEGLTKWTEYFRNICQILTAKKMYHSLYNIQIFLNDYVRCCLSCLKFYVEDVKNFSELKEKNRYIEEANDWLIKALGAKDWLQVNQSASSAMQFEVNSIENENLLMILSKAQIQRYLELLELQKEVVDAIIRFEENYPTLLEKVQRIEIQNLKDINYTNKFPVVYESNIGKIKSCIYLLVGNGQNIKNIFGLVKKAILITKIDCFQVFVKSAILFVQIRNTDAVFRLVECIQNTEEFANVSEKCCDEVLLAACRTCLEQKLEMQVVINLSNLMKDASDRMTVYLEANQLKLAFTFALRHQQNKELFRLYVHADNINNTHITKICKIALGDKFEKHMKKHIKSLEKEETGSNN